MLHPIVIALALAFQTPADTVIEVRGIVQASDDPSMWKILLAYPLRIGTLSVGSVRLPGSRWSRFENRLVQARGTARADAGIGVTLDGAKVNEIRPEGGISRSVSPMTSQRASLTLAVVPSKFSWTKSNGDSTGVHPAIVFALTNQGDVPLQFEFPTNDILCVSVRERGYGKAHWRYAWTDNLMNRRVTIAIGNALRWVIPLPPEAADQRNTYVVEVSLCGARIYGGEAEFDVT
jgi:hypothetical protein